MEDIAMKKSVLLEKLRENQKAHKAIFAMRPSMVTRNMPSPLWSSTCSVSGMALDDWKSKRQFLESNKAYSLTAARMSEAYDR